MEPEPEQRKRDRVLSSPTGCTPRQGSKRSRSRIPVASPQVCRPTNRSGQHRKSGTSPGSSRIPVAVRSSSTKTEIKPSNRTPERCVTTPTRSSASSRRPLIVRRRISDQQSTSHYNILSDSESVSIVVNWVL